MIKQAILASAIAASLSVPAHAQTWGPALNGFTQGYMQTQDWLMRRKMQELQLEQMRQGMTPAYQPDLWQPYQPQHSIINPAVRCQWIGNQYQCW
jgi:hypothetical protein